MSNTANAPAPNVPYFTPSQYPPAGSAVVPQPDGKPIPKLFQPLKIRGLEFHNRIFLSPMCQYSSDEGHSTPWHMAHLGGIFTRGPGLSLLEATSVLPEGRITSSDAGLWADSHIAPLADIVQFAHSQNQKIGIQLSHAGRKASTTVPWLEGASTASPIYGGWPDDVMSPSDIPHSKDYPQPKALTTQGIQDIIRAFALSAQRAIKAGCDVIEIQGAHGYLIHAFLSPVSNHRTDEYGGSFENRTRLAIDIVDAIRAVIPPSMPLFFRISATDWLEQSLADQPSWTTSETIKLAPILYAHGVDLLDISSAGLHPLQKIPRDGPMGAYQAPLSGEVKKSLPADCPLIISAVGSITTGHIAQNILDLELADLVFVGKQFQKNPGSVWAFAEDLGVDINLAHQISWPVKGRGGKKSILRHLVKK
ncbi:hypothetical protein ONZ45_g5910 [Pleurotus djamor]|nr:hypothetical protein ONZ45_g5910 [Pleurotus djamor]